MTTTFSAEQSRSTGDIRVCEGRSSLFFFQAEDGIRDIGVTGVQTCALPISGPHVLEPYERALDLRVEDRAERDRQPRPQHGGHCTVSQERRQAELHRARERRGRSEERRVGKEGRSRWAPYH